MTVADPATAASTQEGLDEERRRFRLLLDGLDLIDQGLSVFDSDLRLVAVNRRMMTMLEFPSELARIGTPFADFIRFNAARGEYGEGDVEGLVAERIGLARRFEPHLLERTRPDGTVITVAGEPISHGGWVTIYTDVTQQRRHDEDLERRVNEAVAEQKRLQAALLHAQKLEAVGALAGGLAHDFSNLLTVVIGSLNALRDRGLQTADATELVESALVYAQRGAVITRRLLAFARRQPLEPSIVEVNRLIANLIVLSRHSLPATIRVSSEVPPHDLYTRVDPQQLEHALLNLVLNARDAMPQGGSLVVRSAVRDVLAEDAAQLHIPAGRYVEVSVQDTGVGMDRATKERAFEPFFTTKAFGSGSGLGLATVYGFAKQSDGTVQIESEPGKGTLVRLLLAASAPPASEATAKGSRPKAGSSRLVLLVEDDMAVRAVIRRQLTDMGHMVIEAPAGDEALAIVDGAPELSVLVTDVVMPGVMDGRRLAELAKQRRPELRVVLVTGYADGAEGQTGRLRSFALLRKPCTREQLAEAIEAAPGR